MKIIIYGKPKKEIKLGNQEWFAWYPVWAWNVYRDLSLVWLEVVRRRKNEKNSLKKYVHFVK